MSNIDTKLYDRFKVKETVSDHELKLAYYAEVQNNPSAAKALHAAYQFIIDARKAAELNKESGESEGKEGASVAAAQSPVKGTLTTRPKSAPARPNPRSQPPPTPTASDSSLFPSKTLGSKPKSYTPSLARKPEPPNHDNYIDKPQIQTTEADRVEAAKEEYILSHQTYVSDLEYVQTMCRPEMFLQQAKKYNEKAYICSKVANSYLIHAQVTNDYIAKVPYSKIDADLQRRGEEQLLVCMRKVRAGSELVSQGKKQYAFCHNQFVLGVQRNCYGKNQFGKTRSDEVMEKVFDSFYDGSERFHDAAWLFKEGVALCEEGQKLYLDSYNNFIEGAGLYNIMTYPNLGRAI